MSKEATLRRLQGLPPIPVDGDWTDQDLRALMGMLPYSIQDDPTPSPPVPAPSALAICYPQIALLSQAIAGINTSTAKNLFYGGGNLFMQRTSPGTVTRVRCDLGGGNGRGVDYVALRRVNLLTALDEGNISITLYGSNDNFSTKTPIIELLNLSTTILLNGQDYFHWLEDLSAPFRYWEVEITSSASIVHRLGKCYFGELRDFGRCPSYPYSYSLFNGTEAFVSDTGAMFKSQTRNRKRSFTFNWLALTDDQRNSFDKDIGRYLDTFQLALHNVANTPHKALGGDRLVWGYAETSNNSGPVEDLNELQFELIEDMV